MANEHRTIRFNEYGLDESDEELLGANLIEDTEGEDPELVRHALEIEEKQFRRFQPPSSLQLDIKTIDNNQDHEMKKGKPNESSQPQQPNVANTSGGEIGVFDFDFEFDIDKAEDIVDYSVYENRTGLAEDMKFLASMPELCDITFLVGETREPVCAVKAVLASRSRVFHKLLYGQKQQLSVVNPVVKEEKASKRKDSPRDTKLKLFLKRSSEPILNGLPFNQQQVGLYEMAGQIDSVCHQPSIQTHQTMIIEEFEPDVFRQLIEYIHTGCVTLQARTLLGLLNAADYYGLEELRRACIGFVTCCITVDTVNSILASAERYIQYKCTKSLVQRVLGIFRLILSREELKADELTKFQAALHWSQRSCDASCGTVDLRDVMANFLECIEFYKIPASVLMREVHPVGVVPDHIIMNALAFQADPSSVDIRKVESPNRFRRMTLPHAFNLAGSDLIHLRHTANFWAERVEAAAANNGSTSPSKEVAGEKDRKEKPSRIGRRRASKPFKRSKTLMESS
ncbi:hypothetical protein RDWZM_004402 [Blomia tropicalis]|uniref:BTB domain-containing protein n=1 Tax=Blomia tropicalis TaxID=40697 RepID=A0A9Q0MJX2_BLOTA|nr:hypothetical protein RDWZM_004402 [Blomia tropicalis]